MPTYYTVPEFAKLKNTTRQTIYNAIKRGDIETAEAYGLTLIRKNKTNDAWSVMESKKRSPKRRSSK